MIFFPSGKYLMGMLDPARGTLSPDEPASRFIALPAFYMDRLEITVQQFRKFDPAYTEKPFTDAKECLNCPAMGISWEAANSYCHWAEKRLPTESEWVAAARGKLSFPWPWGIQFSPDRANLLGDEDGYLFAAPVGSYPQGASHYGVLDLIGNVWEWVSTPPSNPNEITQTQGKKKLRMAKGGGWTSRKENAKVSYKNIVDPEMKNPTFGFRCAKSAHPD